MDTRDGLRNFTVTIDITRDDIERGEPQNCHDCPAALALSRTIPESTYVSVAGSYAKVDVDGITYKAMSGELLNFVVKFDTNEYVYPQRIRLNFVERI